MQKRILIIFIVLILMVVSTTPVLADTPPQSNGKGNTTNENNGNGNSADGEEGNGNSRKDKGNPQNDNGRDRNPASPGNQNSNQGNAGDELINTSSENSTKGFNEAGYNYTAGIFNGIAWDWCLDKVGDPAWCEAYLGEYAHDRIIMKWNAEWDRGNDEGWSDPPYDAWENNQWNGKVPGGSGEVWHYKIVWVGDCQVDKSLVPPGGYCIWGQFAVLMDHGTSDGMHEWLAHANPSGYGSYP